MRNMSRFWRVLTFGVSIVATLFWVTNVRAVPLTSVDWDTFTGIAGLLDLNEPVVDPLFDVYRFGDAWAPGAIHGTVYSQVFKGKNAAAGLFVYVYQIEHKMDPSGWPQYEYPLGGLSFKTFTNIPPPTVGNTQFFAITSGSPTIGFNALGDDAPDDAQYTPLGPLGQIGFTFTPKLTSGATSNIFGFFHPLPPTTAVANLIDSEPEKLNPFVYTPTPEPSTFVLLVVGLSGGLIYGRRRFLLRK